MNFFGGFLPSKYSFLVFILFYIAGLIFTIFLPSYTAVFFQYGFFLGKMEVTINLPTFISFDYFIDQFIYNLGAISLDLFLNNLKIIILCIFTGVALISAIFIGLFAFTGSLTVALMGKYGILNAILILLGSFHLSIEILAAMLAIDAFLMFYGSFIRLIKQGDVNIFKKRILNEFLPLILKIISLLAVAAISEVFWSTWWVYILTNPYISWYEFYFGVYSILIH
jgi:hypothetical protein